MTILQEGNYCVIVLSLGEIVSLAVESNFLEFFFVLIKVLISPEKMLRNVSKLWSLKKWSHTKKVMFQMLQMVQNLHLRWNAKVFQSVWYFIHLKIFT